MQPPVYSFLDESGRLCFLAAGQGIPENELKFRKYLEEVLSCASKELDGNITIAVGNKSEDLPKCMEVRRISCESTGIPVCFGNRRHHRR